MIGQYNGLAANLKKELEREKHAIMAQHEQEHESFEDAQKYTEHSMTER